MYKLGVKENKKNNSVFWCWYDEFNRDKTRGCYNTRQAAIKDINNIPVEIDIPLTELDYTIL